MIFRECEETIYAYPWGARQFNPLYKDGTFEGQELRIIEYSMEMFRFQIMSGYMREKAVSYAFNKANILKYVKYICGKKESG